MARKIAYWVTTVLLAVGYLIGGFADLVQLEGFVEQTAKLGYPLLFFRILGFWKLVGAVVILLPGLPRAKPSTNRLSGPFCAPTALPATPTRT